MGLLKHAIFPLLTLMYANNVVQFLILKNGKALMAHGGWPDPVGSPWEDKLLSMIGGGSLMMLLGTAIGLLTEDGHYRAIFAGLNFVSFAYDAYDSYNLGFPYQFSAGMAIFVGIGLAAHALEPGFLTKDKSKKTKQK